MRKKLEVKDLAIAFRTPNGQLKAVRGIDLDLYEGETLAIVGESGSGKSVSSKAIMGILAPNAIVKSGEILYEGHDLLKLKERELQDLRGDKIAMIFQDPMSSLNPIVRIGKQLTETMLIKNRLRKRQAKAEIKQLLRELAAASPHRSVFEQESRRYIKLARESAEKEATFRQAKDVSGDVLRRVRDLLPVFDKKTDDDLAAFWKGFYPLLAEAAHPDGALKSAGEQDAGDRAGLRLRLTAMQEQLEKYPKMPDYFEEVCGKESGDESSNGPCAGFIRLVAESLECIGKKTQASHAETVEKGRDAREVVEKLYACVYELSYTLSKGAAKRRALRLMDEVGIPDSEKRFNQYPFQLSGGQRQRIVIAIALSADPDILICDEPTTALDVTIQAQILELIDKVKRERKLSVLFITHDLGVVANIADRVAVMYAGKIVEYGTTDELFYSPAHPYTWALLSSVPDPESREKLAAIPGTPPNMLYPPAGDAFAARNPYALEIDFEEEPPMFPITETHYAATWLLHPYAPKVELPKSVADRIARMQQREEVSHA